MMVCAGCAPPKDAALGCVLFVLRSGFYPVYYAYMRRPVAGNRSMKRAQAFYRSAPMWHLAHNAATLQSGPT